MYSTRNVQRVVSSCWIYYVAGAFVMYIHHFLVVCIIEIWSKGANVANIMF